MPIDRRPHTDQNSGVSGASLVTLGATICSTEAQRAVALAAAPGAKMSSSQVRRLPVIDQDERLCGIVSLGDLSRETDSDCATEALEGVSQPGGEHRQ